MEATTQVKGWCIEALSTLTVVAICGFAAVAIVCAVWTLGYNLVTATFGGALQFAR